MDNWSVNNRLSLALGIRFANDNLHAPAQCSLKTDFSASQCYDKVQLPIWKSAVPRLNFAYDVGGDGRSVIKGGWGRYVAYGSITSDLLVAARNNRQVTTWLWHDNNGDRLYQQGEVNLDPSESDFQSIAGVTNGVVNPDMPQPKYDQYILGYEREVLRNWNVRGTGIYARNFDLRRTENINIPYAAYNIPITNPDPGFDGRIGTSDDPGTSITYYEYPTTLSGISNQSTRQVGWPGQQTLQDHRVVRQQAALGRLAVQYVVGGNEDQPAIHRRTGAGSELGDQHRAQLLGDHKQSGRWLHVSLVQCGGRLPTSQRHSAGAAVSIHGRHDDQEPRRQYAAGRQSSRSPTRTSPTFV